MTTMSHPMLLSLLLLLLASFAHAQQASVAPTSCSKQCAPFEACVVFDGAEFCAQECVPGRCDESAGETCVLRGVLCEASPCLPVATCEVSGKQSLTPAEIELQLAALNAAANSSSVNATAAAVAAVAKCYNDCPKAFSPVCASNNVSYANSCFLDRAKCLLQVEAGSAAVELTVVSSGLCPKDAEFSNEYNPAPAVSDDAQPDVAVLVANCSSYNGIVCADVDDPVCSSAGTLRNICHFNRARRCLEALAASSTSTSRTAVTIQLLRTGSCESSSSATSNSNVQCPESCPAPSYTASTSNTFTASVCASTGMLFSSSCEFRRAKCARSFLVGGLSRQSNTAMCLQ